MDDLYRPIDCPVPWCTGSLIDHGGLGDLPHDWVHSDGAGQEVAPGWRLARTQTAGGPITWHLEAQHVEVMQAGSAAALAAGLTKVAQSVMDALR